MSLTRRLYQGDFHADFIGRRRRWYTFSSVVILVCLVSIIFRGFSFSIDFKGGALFQFPANGNSVSDVRSMLGSVGVNSQDAVVQELSSSKTFRVQTPTLTNDETNKVQSAIVTRFKTTPDKIDISTVGASWGSTITTKALQGLVVFLIVVMIYLSIRFEWKMAASAMVALIHDLVVTAGVYSIVGFEVSPSTVIALLTILGFSLYDTVVVFDKVRENTATIGTTGRKTYAEAANDALNETLMRSINTSLIALLPVGSLLFVGAGLLGAGTLEDLALAQFVGLASGAYSSIFVATPLLVDMKKNEPRIKTLTERVNRQRAAAEREAAKVSAGVVDAAVTDSADGEPTYAASGTRPAAGARPRPAAGRRPPPPRKGGRGGRPSGKRRR